MNSSKFKYFRDPDSFAFRIDDRAECSICKNIGLWFDASGFYGEDDLEIICDDCLVTGKLMEREYEIFINDAFGGNEEETNIIMYKTPPLPTWQDMVWPSINGQYCVFEGLASREDFESQEEFKKAFIRSDDGVSDLDYLWEALPKKRITTYKQAYAISIYLFTCNGEKYCTWDRS